MYNENCRFSYLTYKYVDLLMYRWTQGKLVVRRTKGSHIDEIAHTLNPMTHVPIYHLLGLHVFFFHHYSTNDSSVHHAHFLFISRLLASAWINNHHVCLRDRHETRFHQRRTVYTSQVLHTLDPRGSSTQALPSTHAKQSRILSSLDLYWNWNSFGAKKSGGTQPDLSPNVPKT